MRFLLDTHAFIWWDNQQDKLSSHVLGICNDFGNQLYLSMASIWEMQIKTQVAKLSLPLPLDQMVEDQISQNRVQLLPIIRQHVYALSSLPDLHKDPFDRILIAQARFEELTLITIDPHIAQYPVNTVW